MIWPASESDLIVGSNRTFDFSEFLCKFRFEIYHEFHGEGKQPAKQIYGGCEIPNSL